MEISPADNPKSRHKICHAFTACELGRSGHSYPVKVLMKKFKHLQGLPIPAIDKVKPVVLIGSDFPHLLTLTQPVRVGQIGEPVAIFTSLGWMLQGPASLLHLPINDQQCFFLTLIFRATWSNCGKYLH